MRFKTLLSIGVLFLLSSVIALAALDLQFSTAISQSPDPASAGNIVTFTVSFKTTGGAVTDLKIIGGVDGTQLFERTYASILADKTKTDSFTWTATAGSHTVWFELDPTHSCGDSNYGNNRIEKAITVSGGGPAGKPDLALNVSYSPKTFNKDEPVVFSIEVLNNGTKISAGCWMFFLVNDWKKQSFDVPSIEAGGTWNTVYSWNAGCDEILKIKVDYNKANIELNEGNNSWTQTMKCGFEKKISRPDFLASVSSAYIQDMNGPDLTVKITKIYKSPYDSTDKTATVEFEVSNIGKAASVPCNMTAKRGGADEMYFDVPALSAGQSYTDKFGEEYVCSQMTSMHIDTDNKNVEIDEKNNVAKKIILCLSEPKKITNNFK